MTISAHKPVRSLRRALLVGCALAGLGGMAGRAQAQAFNGTPATAFGGVAYDRATPNVETITISTNTAVINWNVANATFLPLGNTATFQNGPNNTNFVVLNRLTFTGGAVRRHRALPPRRSGRRLADRRHRDVPGTERHDHRRHGILRRRQPRADLLVRRGRCRRQFLRCGDAGIALNAGPSPVGGPSVVTEAGARLNALQPNSYVA